jgi:hypothetical protein
MIVTICEQSRKVELELLPGISAALQRAITTDASEMQEVETETNYP